MGCVNGSAGSGPAQGESRLALELLCGRLACMQAAASTVGVQARVALARAHSDSGHSLCCPSTYEERCGCGCGCGSGAAGASACGRVGGALTPSVTFTRRIALGVDERLPAGRASAGNEGRVEVSPERALARSGAHSDAAKRGLGWAERRPPAPPGSAPHAAAAAAAAVAALARARVDRTRQRQCAERCSPKMVGADDARGLKSGAQGPPTSAPQPLLAPMLSQLPACAGPAATNRERL